MNDSGAPPHSTSPAPEIGRVAFRELRAVARLQRASFRSGLAYGVSALVILWAVPGVIFLVARTSTGVVVGCAIADRYRGDLRVMNIAVLQSHRRQGIGRALLRALGDAVTDGNIVLMVEEWNVDAQNLYTSEGFRRIGHIRDYYGRNRHGIRMRKFRGDQADQHGHRTIVA